MTRLDPEGLRRHALGVLVALHLLAVAIMALPSTDGLLNRKAWKEQSVQREFAVWADLFRAVGIDLTVPELEDRLWTVATTYAGFHGAVRAPLQPYMHYCGTAQNWQMFPAPQVRPTLIHVDVHTAEGWQPVYRTRSETLTWNAAFFDHDRVRTMTFLYGWPHIRKRGLFVDLMKHLWPRLAADFPHADQGRIGIWRYTTLTPAEVREGKVPTGRYEARTVEPLAGYR